MIQEYESYIPSDFSNQSFSSFFAKPTYGLSKFAKKALAKQNLKKKKSDK